MFLSSRHSRVVTNESRNFASGCNLAAHSSFHLRPSILFTSQLLDVTFFEHKEKIEDFLYLPVSLVDL